MKQLTKHSVIKSVPYPLSRDSSSKHHSPLARQSKSPNQADTRASPGPDIDLLHENKKLRSEISELRLLIEKMQPPAPTLKARHQKLSRACATPNKRP